MGVGAVRTTVGLHVLNLLICDVFESGVIIANAFVWERFAAPLFTHIHSLSENTSVGIQALNLKPLEIQQAVSELVVSILGRKIDADMPFIDAGFDSMCLAEFSQSVERRFDLPVPSTVTFDHPTISSLSAFICDKSANLPTKPSCSQLEIVCEKRRETTTHVVAESFALRTGGTGFQEVTSPFDFWTMITCGQDAVRRIPTDRWDVDDTSTVHTIRKRDPVYGIYSKYGSFIREVDIFDAKFFELAPSVRHIIEPQQREILKVCREVYYGQDVHVKSTPFENTTSVFVGICTNDSEAVGRDVVVRSALCGVISTREKNILPSVVQGMSESTYAFASNRVSHMFGFQGESMSIDCASASGLVCVHLAMNSLKLRGVVNVVSDSAIAASVNMIMHRQLSDLHIARQIFPVDGRCKTFDVSADGFERGEGTGAILMHAASLTRNDPVRFVLAGSSCIHKGGGASLRALRGPAIEYKVHCALLNSALLPKDVTFVEASGLGEPLGDAIEIGAYQTVFCSENLSRTSTIGFGSVHTNIGHLDGASGMISIIKSALMSCSMIAVPLVHFKKLNPMMLGHSVGEHAEKMGHTWKDVNIDGRSYFPMLKGPILNGIVGTSSFGYGGSMAHVITSAGRTSIMFRGMQPRRGVVIPRLNAGNIHTRSPIVETAHQQLQKLIWFEVHDIVNSKRTGSFPVQNCEFCDDITVVSIQRVLDTIAMDHCPYRLAESTLRGPIVANIHDLVVRAMALELAVDGINVNERVCKWLDKQVQRYKISTDPDEHVSPDSNQLQMAKLDRKIVFVLASPRSGSTLLQMMLNTNAAIFAPQELYLLNFETMAQRQKALSRGHSWALEGLRKAIMELRGCFADEADKILEEMQSLSTHKVYTILQEWCGERILVDKTPPYAWSLDNLMRAEMMFKNAHYIFIHRHPYASINSMVKETLMTGTDRLKESMRCLEIPTCDQRARSRDAACTQVWNFMDNLWSQGNSNIVDFLKGVDKFKCVDVYYEDLVSNPMQTMRNICSILNMAYNDCMVHPYSGDGTRTFEPVEPGGSGAADPNILNHREIEPRLANAWNSVNLIGKLSEKSMQVASALGYRLPIWKQLGTQSNRKFLKRLNAHTRTPVILFIQTNLDRTFKSWDRFIDSITSAAFAITVDYNTSHATCIADVAETFVRCVRDDLGVTTGDEVVLVTRDSGMHVATEVIRKFASNTVAKTASAWQSHHSVKDMKPTVLGLIAFLNPQFERTLRVDAHGVADAKKYSVPWGTSNTFNILAHERIDHRFDKHRSGPIGPQMNAQNTRHQDQLLNESKATRRLFTLSDISEGRAKRHSMDGLPVCVITESEHVCPEYLSCHFGVDPTTLLLERITHNGIIDECLVESILISALRSVENDKQSK